jgi:hypothetical protein
MNETPDYFRIFASRTRRLRSERSDSSMKSKSLSMILSAPTNFDDPIYSDPLNNEFDQALLNLSKVNRALFGDTRHGYDLL